MRKIVKNSSFFVSPSLDVAGGLPAAGVAKGRLFSIDEVRLFCYIAALPNIRV